MFLFYLMPYAVQIWNEMCKYLEDKSNVSQHFMSIHKELLPRQPQLAVPDELSSKHVQQLRIHDTQKSCCTC